MLTKVTHYIRSTCTHAHLGGVEWVEHVLQSIKEQLLPQVVIGDTLPVDVVLQPGDHLVLSVTFWNELADRQKTYV